MRRVSKKRAEQNKEYKVIRDKYLVDNKHCEISYCEICDYIATEVHHTNGRSGLRLLDTNYFMAVCRTCHQYAHNNPKEARERGWLK